MKIDTISLSGVFAPLPTPFDRAHRLDLARLRTAFARWVASPLSGFVLLGSNGEAVLLDEAESDRVIASARESVPVGRPLIVGTGRESTEATVQATKRAAELGADAALVRTPAFFKPQMTSDAFVRHYTAVADASPIPILLYNFSAMTGVNLLPAAVSRLSPHVNIIGIKESGSDVSHLSALVASSTAGFSVLTGSAATFYPGLCAGASGGILAISSVMPEACVRLFELTRSGNHAEAQALQEQLLPLARLLGSTHGVPGVKAALNLIGFDVGYPRPPLMPLAETAVAAVREALHALQGSLV
jgi:dihydrodipicolinate synthase/N-acetylneuraminate lyase